MELGIRVQGSVREGEIGNGKKRIDGGGNTHQSIAMPTKIQPRFKLKSGVTVVERYDVAADTKKRINLRHAKTKYFHVKALSNGCYLLEPRVLVPPQAISAPSLKMFDKSVARLKNRQASAPIDLAAFREE
jgi:hypothetical protein